MTGPLVSVCLPNLNNRPYLQERVDTVLAQTYPHWELVVSDNYSDDGAWPFLEALARADRRVRAEQAPREGMYANWNRCVARARGKYVYIATSDDTMAADCLEKLVAALEAHPGCDIAHCPLRQIDGEGKVLPDTWTDRSLFALSSGPLLHRVHVRRAPFDGVLYLLGGSVYISITQLLIRRTLFDRIGAFEPRWGSVGDFNWVMRAVLVADTVHVPDTWGGWRVHASQATARVGFSSDAHARTVDEMIDHAIAASRPLLPAAVADELASRWAVRARDYRGFTRDVGARRQNAAPRRIGYLLRHLLAGSAPAREYLALRLQRRSSADWARRRLAEAGYGEALIRSEVYP